MIQSNITITMNFSRFMVQELDSFFLFSSLVEKLTCCLRLLCMPSKCDLFFFLSSAGKAYAANQPPTRTLEAEMGQNRRMKSLDDS